MSDSAAAQGQASPGGHREVLTEFVLADFIVANGFVSGPDELVDVRLPVRSSLSVAPARAGEDGPEPRSPGWPGLPTAHFGGWPRNLHWKRRRWGEE
jgi:hypothetical protein